MQLFNVSGLGPQIDSIIKKAAQVNAAGIVLSEQLVALTIVNALPKSYQLLSSTILATIDLATLKPATVRPKIIKEEQQCMANKVSVLRILKALQLRTKCEKCGRNNHTTEQYWDKKPSGTAQQQFPASGSGGGQMQGQAQEGGGKKKHSQKAKKQDNTMLTNMLQIVEVLNVLVVDVSESITISLYSICDQKAKWMLDSGCNCHVTSVKSDFVSYHDFPTPEYTKTAGQSQLIEIKGHRMVYVKHILDNGIKCTLILSEVLYVPQASTWFFAPSALIKQGHYVTITTDSFNLYHKLPKADGSPQLIFSGVHDKLMDLY